MSPQSGNAPVPTTAILVVSGRATASRVVVCPQIGVLMAKLATSPGARYTGAGPTAANEAWFGTNRPDAVSAATGGAPSMLQSPPGADRCMTNAAYIVPAAPCGAFPGG